MRMSSAKIVAVDDSRTYLAAIQGMLERNGFTKVTLLTSASQALSFLSLPDPENPDQQQGDLVDLIILDVVMPDMNGIELCRRLRERSHLRRVPIMMITSRVDMETLEQSFQAGATDYVRKPVEEVEFIARVQAALNFKREMDRCRLRELDMLRLTSQLTEVNQQLRLLSNMDGLTGVANRRFFDKIFESEWRRALRSQRYLALFMIDIDHFKLYNDRYGHQSGDDCLRSVASALDQGLRRPGDLLCRYGGEEFAALLPDTEPEGALKLARQLCQHIRDLSLKHEASPQEKYVTVSVGATSRIPQKDMSPNGLLRDSDEALYRAKSNGRNQAALNI